MKRQEAAKLAAAAILGWAEQAGDDVESFIEIYEDIVLEHATELGIDYRDTDTVGRFSRLVDGISSTRSWPNRASTA